MIQSNGQVYNIQLLKLLWLCCLHFHWTGLPLPLFLVKTDVTVIKRVFSPSFFCGRDTGEMYHFIKKTISRIYPYAVWPWICGWNLFSSILDTENFILCKILPADWHENFVSGHCGTSLCFEAGGSTLTMYILRRAIQHCCSSADHLSFLEAFLGTRSCIQIIKDSFGHFTNLHKDSMYELALSADQCHRLVKHLAHADVTFWETQSQALRNQYRDLLSTLAWGAERHNQAATLWGGMAGSAYSWFVGLSPSIPIENPGRLCLENS